MARQPAVSPALWGWSDDLTVETETLTERGAQRSVQAVYVDGEHVGYVVSRANWRGAREWDYTSRTEPIGPDLTYGMIYPSNSRQQALVHLVEQVTR